MFARGWTGGPTILPTVYTLLLTFKGERGVEGGEGGAVYEAVAEHTGRRASGVVAAAAFRGGSGGATLAVVGATGKEAPETSRSFGGASWLHHPSLYYLVQQGVEHIWETFFEAQHLQI